MQVSLFKFLFLKYSDNNHPVSRGSNSVFRFPSLSIPTISVQANYEEDEVNLIKFVASTYFTNFVILFRCFAPPPHHPVPHQPPRASCSPPAPPAPLSCPSPAQPTPLCFLYPPHLLLNVASVAQLPAGSNLKPLLFTGCHVDFPGFASKLKD